MSGQLSIREFLERNPDFVFHLPEYVESTRFIEQAQRRFESFCRSFSASHSITASWQNKREVIERTARKLPAYDCIDWARPDYWESIPFIDKDSLRARAKDFLNPHYDPGRLWLRETSGTTGPPVAIWYTSDFFFEFHLFGACKATWLAGALTRDVLERPVFCLALFDNKYLTDRIWAPPNDFRGFTLRPIFDERSPSAVNKLTALLHRHRPAVVTLKPNILNLILHNLSESLTAAVRHINLIISGGSDLDPTLRKTGERLLKVPILDSYGLSEFGAIASECHYKDGLHIYEQDLIAEVLEVGGSLREAGRGELVLSSVANRAMPLLRYRTGDIVELTSEPCPCGKMGRRIRAISGRIVRNFKLSDGSEFAPTNLNNLFKIFPVREFRLTQTDRNQVKAEIELLPSCSNPTEEMSLIRKHIEREMSFLARVDISPVVFSPGDKFQRFTTLV